MYLLVGAHVEKGEAGHSLLSGAQWASLTLG